jgi:hypothetical protein
VHVNNLGTFPSGDPAELTGLTRADQDRLALSQKWAQEMSGYAIVQSTRPQTLAYALTDSPAGQLAWIVEKFREWADPAASLPGDAVDRDLILTDVSIYWLTGTAGSAARIYYEGARTWGQAQPKSPVPTGVAVFPTTSLSGRWPNVTTTWCAGPSSPAVVISPPWKHPTSSSATSASSSARSADTTGNPLRRAASQPAPAALPASWFPRVRRAARSATMIPVAFQG